MSGSNARSGKAGVSAATTSIDAQGLHVPASLSGVLDVIFDGRRVWSVSPADGPVGGGRGRRCPWPEALRPFLDGVARVTVREHVTGEVLADEEVAFGSGRGRVRVADHRGRALAVTKWGRMNHPFDAADRGAVDAYLDQVEEVIAVLRDDCGLPAFLSYGNLLGAVREGRLIGHDVDADLGYLSACEHPADVMRESFRIERAFRRRGWKLRRENGGFLALFPTQPDGSVRNIDVFTSFFLEGFLYQVHDIWARLPRSAVLPLGGVMLEGREFPAPADPPMLLAAAYGPGWRVPDPSFHFKTPRPTVRRTRGWLGGLRDQRDYWNKVHADEHLVDHPEPSPFAEWVSQREPEGTIVDIGCGTGGDALWFARFGRDVLGLDYAAAGVRRARAAASRESLPAAFEVCNLYDLRQVLTLGAQLALDDRPTVLYSRFLVEALEDHGRHHLWRLAEMALRGGGQLFLEFRVRGGSRAPHVSGEDLRRLLDPDTVAEEIRSRGGHVRHTEVAHGLARRTDGDPYVCRFAVEWP